MLHETPLIATIVAGLGLAFVFGTIAQRFSLPPLVGYLLAGVAVGPFTPGFVADQPLATELAELGIILLMFGVGLHFSLKDLLSVKAIAVPGAVAQIAVATLLGLGLAVAMGWTIGAGLVFGLALSVASTVVLLRAMQERRLMDTERGRIAVGWLIVEDLAMVLALVLFPALASLQGGTNAAPAHGMLATDLGLGLAGVLLVTFFKIALFIALMLVVGRRLIPWILHYIAHTGSRELFRLAVLAIALGVAFGSTKLFDVSLALGAFFAGMMLRESPLSQRAAQESLPLRDAFAVLAFRHPVSTALTISASLAQIGEFSFILAELGVASNLLPKAGRDLILAGAIFSIMLNPLVFWIADRLAARAGEKGESPSAAPATAAKVPIAMTKLTDHTILVGYGRVGSLVGAALKRKSLSFVAVEAADAAPEKLRQEGIEVITGNAARADVLGATNPGQARHLVIAIPEAFEAGQIVQQARAANTAIRIIARAHSDAEVDHLQKLGADVVIMGEREIAHAMIEELDRRNDNVADSSEAASGSGV